MLFHKELGELFMGNLINYLVLIALIGNAMPACAQENFGSRVDIQLGEEYGEEYDEKYKELFDSYKNYPVWSYDGKWIAFIAIDRTSIFIVPSKGGEAVLVYRLFETIEKKWINMLCFSRDSQEITFDLWVFDEDRGSYLEYVNEEKTMVRYKKLIPAIESVNIYTGQHRIITEGGFHPNWSSDKRYLTYIYFDVNTHIDDSQIVYNGVPVIYDKVTGEKRYLTNENLPARSYKYWDPTISPDNKYVYIGIREKINDKSIGQLYRILFEGGDFEQLTFFEDARGYCRNLNFSPDGAWLIFDYSWGTGLYVYNTITGQTFDAFTGEEINKPYYQEEYGWEENPSWMPDGTTFCYNMLFGGRNDYQDKIEIYICGFDTTKYAVLPTLVENSAPSSFVLLRNYPNPFNPATTIEFSIPEAGFVDLVIYDITGRKIRELMSGEMTPGVHSVLWDGRDDKGSPVSSGVFISRLKSGNNVVSNRMMLVK